MRKKRQQLDVVNGLLQRGALLFNSGKFIFNIYLVRIINVHVGSYDITVFI